MDNTLDEKKPREISTGRPLQRIPYSQKIADDNDWFKQNLDYEIGNSSFMEGMNGVGSMGKRSLNTLYDVYNNKFPMHAFKHITDPLNAVKAEHRNYPAKVRPTSMIRTNIDLLLGEYPLRPFSFQVVNMGEDAYNSYLDGLNKTIQSNIEEHFLAVAQAEMQQQGNQMQQIPQDQEIPVPDEIKERFNGTYKDNLAVRGNRWMKRAMTEYSIRPRFLKMFKDWLIAGTSISYKNIENAGFVYERVSPREISLRKSEDKDFFEDAEVVVRRSYHTYSDVVDKFYDELKDQDHKDLESRAIWNSPQSAYAYIQTVGQSNYQALQGQIPVYHCQWKGKKQIIFAEYTDPFTGSTQEVTLDEDTQLDDTIKVTSRKWVNEVYEGWRLGDNIYVRMRALPVQRNEMNNFSSCKLSYNGRNFSDTHSENISILEMGMPYAIMYMITNFTIEKTIAKNKGKITLVEQNSIPQKDGWDEEKFFYYADALGYMIINRNQIGVDKSFNQYQTLDMSLFSDIKNLIELRDSFVRDWDSLLGITPQRKAQIETSAGKGTTEQSIFRSTVMTDLIFNLYEEFTEKELQGFLDYSRFVNVNGIRSIYNTDDFDKELLDIDPNSYCNAELGIFAKSSSEEGAILNAYKQNTQAFIQNGVKQSTILEIQMANNLAELKEKLKAVEAIEIKQAQAQEATEHDREVEIEEIKEKFATLQSMLRKDEINTEWDRKDQNEMIKGEYDVVAQSQNKMDADNGVSSAMDVGKNVAAQFKLLSDERTASAEIQSRERIQDEQSKLANKELALDRDALEQKREAEENKLTVAKLKAATEIKKARMTKNKPKS